MKLAICILLLLVAGSAAAQDNVVRAVKARLEATGVPLDGPCGAFGDHQAGGGQLRATGAGTLDKPSGNNCGGRSVDIIIAYPDGRLVDILSDAGGSNGRCGIPSGWSMRRGGARGGGPERDGPPALPAPSRPRSTGLLLSRLDALERALQAASPARSPTWSSASRSKGRHGRSDRGLSRARLDQLRDRLTTVESDRFPSRARRR